MQKFYLFITLAFFFHLQPLVEPLCCLIREEINNSKVCINTNEEVYNSKVSVTIPMHVVGKLVTVATVAHLNV